MSSWTQWGLVPNRRTSIRTRWRLTASSLSLALLTTSAVAQTHPTTIAPAGVSAGAFATAVVFEGGEIFVGRGRRLHKFVYKGIMSVPRHQGAAWPTGQ